VAASLLPPAEIKPVKPLEALERREIETALLRHGWVQARAARELGLTQRQIGYKIKKYRLEQPDFLLAEKPQQ
jgi:Nif-specific regulatory protein